MSVWQHACDCLQCRWQDLRVCVHPWAPAHTLVENTGSWKHSSKFCRLGTYIALHANHTQATETFMLPAPTLSLALPLQATGCRLPSLCAVPAAPHAAADVTPSVLHHLLHCEGCVALRAHQAACGAAPDQAAGGHVRRVIHGGHQVPWTTTHARWGDLQTQQQQFGPLLLDVWIRTTHVVWCALHCTIAILDVGQAVRGVLRSRLQGGDVSCTGAPDIAAAGSCMCMLAVQVPVMCGLPTTRPWLTTLCSAATTPLQ